MVKQFPSPILQKERKQFRPAGSLFISHKLQHRCQGLRRRLTLPDHTSEPPEAWLPSLPAAPWREMNWKTSTSCTWSKGFSTGWLAPLYCQNACLQQDWQSHSLLEVANTEYFQYQKYPNWNIQIQINKPLSCSAGVPGMLHQHFLMTQWMQTVRSGTDLCWILSPASHM